MPPTFQDKRVLVTGATGFIGSHLTRRLVNEGAEVHVLTSSVSSVYPVRLVDLQGRITVHEASLTDRDAMEKLVARTEPSLVFHLGAYTHVGKSWNRIEECVQTNIEGTVNLLQALAPQQYDRFVSTGTSEIYGGIEVPFREDAAVNPSSPYSVSKYTAEMYCKILHNAHGWPVVMLRPFNAYGPAQSPDRIIPEIVVRALRGQELKMTQGRQTREFNFVEDLVDGFLLAATAPGVEGEVINLGNGEEISMKDLATQILDLMGNPITAEFGALPDRPGEIWRMYSDSTKARERLGWKPSHSLKDGLAKTIAWYEHELSRADSPFIV
ncbi:MAG: SDR family NAD(P)-dependent oxidoreductase [Acidimicrobiia bacterium]|nr:SDR family NAD(P)-dependent oxidoreductase [Acidimicrobiia bacterium]